MEDHGRSGRGTLLPLVLEFRGSAVSEYGYYRCWHSMNQVRDIPESYQVEAQSNGGEHITATSSKSMLDISHKLFAGPIHAQPVMVNKHKFGVFKELSGSITMRYKHLPIYS